jgi:small subunit ribosomal protein S9
MATNLSATGRRKTATASVILSPGSGTVTVNGRDFNEYFPTATLRDLALASLTVLGREKEFDVKVRASGGGLAGQAGAVRHALARALCAEGIEVRAKLKPLGHLTRDPRMKERKKPGQPGARKRYQFSKR